MSGECGILEGVEKERKRNIGVFSQCEFEPVCPIMRMSNGKLREWEQVLYCRNCWK